MNRKWLTAFACGTGVSVVASVAQSQMIPRSRYSIISASSWRFPGPPIPDVVSYETSGFELFDRTATHGGSASQFSSISPDLVTYTGTAYGAIGGGGSHGDGYSRLTFDFRLVNVCTFDLSGSLSDGAGIYTPEGSVTLRRTDVTLTVFDGGRTSGPFQASGTLPVGTYRFECIVNGRDGNQLLATEIATLRVVPSPSPTLVAGLTLTCLATRRRRVG